MKKVLIVAGGLFFLASCNDRGTETTTTTNPGMRTDTAIIYQDGGTHMPVMVQDTTNWNQNNQPATGTQPGTGTGTSTGTGTGTGTQPGTGTGTSTGTGTRPGGQ